MLEPAEHDALLRHEAKLAVIEALFDHVFQASEEAWPKRVVECLRWARQRGASFDDSWRLAMSLYPPPEDWLGRNRRAVDRLVERGYMPASTRVEEEPSAFRFFFDQCRCEWADTSFKREEGQAA